MTASAACCTSLPFHFKKPGVYQVRAALRDSRSGRLGPASEVIETPNVKNGHLAVSSLLLNEVSGANPAPDETGETTTPKAEGSAAVRIFQPGC